MPVLPGRVLKVSLTIKPYRALVLSIKAHREIIVYTKES